MNQEIKYSGFSAVPSDYECQDGSLAVSINLLPEDGALQPVLAPSQELQLEDGEQVLYIHKTSAFTHYILLKLEEETYIYQLWYYDVATKKRTKISDEDEHISDINSIGNTLIVLYPTYPLYFLWSEGNYKRLGSHLPEINLSFGLQGHPRLFSKTDSSKSTFTITFDKMSINTMMSEFPDTQKTQITSQIMAKVNKFLAEQSVNKGRFSLPFFVRYALRLFDGSLVMHSAPILMNPCTTNNPVVYWTEAYNKDSATSVNNAVCDMMLMACDLDYAYDNVTSDDFSQWTDIIKSVDVFISKPIYPYDQNGEIVSCREKDDFQSVFIGRLYKSGLSGSIQEDQVVSPVNGSDLLDTCYSQWLYDNIYAMYFTTDRGIPWSVFRLPEYTSTKNSENLRNCSNFYLLYSIELSELSKERKVIPIEDEYMQSLVTREAMTDDYLTHDTIVPKYTFGYNNRMNFGNAKRQLFKGFPMSSMLAYCNTRMNFVVNGTTIQLSRPTSNLGQYLTDNYSIKVYIKENGEEYSVVIGGSYDKILSNFLADNSTSGKGDSWGCYFYYPNANAYKMTIIPNGIGAGQQMGQSYDITLKTHDFLNGAYALLDYNLIRKTSGTYSGIKDDYTEFVDVPNKIYTSEVNNPFYFPLLGINTVGTGEIKGICSAAKALSQGQFGQFPLYAFTTEGVWALEVSSTGTYSARQPITRDVCINSEGITQLDSAVLFPTDRGIMLISGSQTTCISEAINSEYPFDATQLPGFTQLHDLLGHNPTTDKCLPTLPFTEFLKKCQMIYDYVHQRVIVYAPSITYAYVYSLKTQQWGMIFSNIASHLNSYPDALAVDNSNAVLSFSVPTADSVKCLYTTRPLKLADANALKTIDCIIQRGFFRKGHVATALYGSRDLFHWHLVWSSKDHYLRGFRGSPYKYFRIAGVATLNADENIYGASVQFSPRQANQPR